MTNTCVLTDYTQLWDSITSRQHSKQLYHSHLRDFIVTVAAAIFSPLRNHFRDLWDKAGKDSLHIKGTRLTYWTLPPINNYINDNQRMSTSCILILPSSFRLVNSSVFLHGTEEIYYLRNIACKNCLKDRYRVSRVRSVSQLIKFWNILALDKVKHKHWLKTAAYIFTFDTNYIAINIDILITKWKCRIQKNKHEIALKLVLSRITNHNKNYVINNERIDRLNWNRH